MSKDRFGYTFDPVDRTIEHYDEQDWDGTTITKMGEAPQLNGASMVQTGNRCPDCTTKLIRFDGDQSGVEICKGCNSKWMVR